MFSFSKFQRIIESLIACNSVLTIDVFGLVLGDAKLIFLDGLKYRPFKREGDRLETYTHLKHILLIKLNILNLRTLYYNKKRLKKAFWTSNLSRKSNKRKNSKNAITFQIEVRSNKIKSSEIFCDLGLISLIFWGL